MRMYTMYANCQTLFLAEPEFFLKYLFLPVLKACEVKENKNNGDLSNNTSQQLLSTFASRAKLPLKNKKNRLINTSSSSA